VVIYASSAPSRGHLKSHFSVVQVWTGNPRLFDRSCWAAESCRTLSSDETCRRRRKRLHRCPQHHKLNHCWSLLMGLCESSSRGISTATHPQSSNNLLLSVFGQCVTAWQLPFSRLICVHVSVKWCRTAAMTQILKNQLSKLPKRTSKNNILDLFTCVLITLAI